MFAWTHHQIRHPAAGMLDNLSVLLTCGAVVLVAWQAIRLDATQSWFTLRRTDKTARTRIRTRRPAVPRRRR